MTTILVVDDEPAICAMLDDTLCEEGYRVQTAMHGQQALRVMATIAVDLVLTDIMMPVLDGVALCCQITANPVTAHIPVILISAGNGEQIPPACRYTAFLRKPFDSAALLTVLEQTVRATRP